MDWKTCNGMKCIHWRYTKTKEILNMKHISFKSYNVSENEKKRVSFHAVHRSILVFLSEEKKTNKPNLTIA